MKIQFRRVRLSPENKRRLDMINTIVEDYQSQGYRLTLRQLYYQLVSRDVIPNQQKEYSKLSGLLKEGRMGGIVDWSAIEDRLRVPSKPSSFDSPADILNAVVNQYKLPRMAGQKTYVEVWVEKDALSGVLKRVTQPYHVPILVCRGYSSASAMFDAYERFNEASEAGRAVHILYLGDFDPSGQDMIRDIKHRIVEFYLGGRNNADDIEEVLKDKDFMDTGAQEYLSKNGIEFEITPIALTRQQIRQYNPPPNPAKRTDPRSDKFISEHGTTSWEVDALRPEVLNQILEDNIKRLIDVDMYDKILKREKKDIKKLKSLTQYL